MRGLKGKLVLITGAGGGIGTALCHRFCEEGCNLALFDIDESAVRKTAKIVEEHGCQAHVRVLDISTYAEVAAAVESLEDDAGPVEVLVNNAGWDHFSYFLDTTPDLWEKLIATNLHGPLNLHHTVLPRMQDRNRGKVVNIASDAGRVGSAMEAVYSACKGGVISFTKTMAREMARTSVRLNVVCPGPTDTALLKSTLDQGTSGEKILAGLERAIPLRRLGQPEDIPGMVAFLASDDADFITGQVISVSGGLTMHG